MKEILAQIQNHLLSLKFFFKHSDKEGHDKTLAKIEDELAKLKPFMCKCNDKN
jgi:hypothetical protein